MADNTGSKPTAKKAQGAPGKKGKKNAEQVAVAAAPEEIKNQPEEIPSGKQEVETAPVENTEKTAPTTAPATSAPAQSQPTEKKQEPQEPQQTQQQQSSGGWGSWGQSWWNAASTAVTNSVSAVSETVREMVVDEPAQPQRPQLYRREEPARAPSATATTGANSGDQPAEDLDLLSVVDKGFSMLGDGVDKLGSFLNQGLTKVAETAHINPTDIQNKAVDYAVSSYQKASNIGEKLANQSVDALESVGKKALGLLTVEENVQNKRRIRPVFNYVPQATQMTKEEQESFEDSLNKNYFDDFNGTAHLQGLEKFSIECTLKYQKVEQKLSKLDAQHREEVVELLNKVKELFDEEEEDKKIEVSDVELNEPANKHKEVIDNLASEGSAKATELVEAFKAEIRELKPEGAESIVSSTDICHLTASYMDKTLLECVRRLSQFSASSVEQLLKIVESYLVDTQNAEGKDAKKMTKDEFIKRVAFAYSVTSMLSEELNTLSNAYIEAMRSLCETGKANFEELGKKGEAELEESKKCTEDIESKLGLHENHILLDTSNAIANIEECRKFLFPICKSFITATLSLPEEPVK
eukprot:TRINITY_DN1500_c0_g1_i2.p1 TRINITY_DN1500_c0_g1~~TRINITY_DN1500_c0_g1_i2.p1  ORF type:complete len:582 (-),score=190.53 TRINITY_DN1500_c0_g1_i2:2163-3908(-)